MKRLENKVAIITGAAGGIGKATALLFAQEGAKVLATDIQSDTLNEWIANINKDLVISGTSHDVTSQNDWQKVVSLAIELYGKLDILVNNAGIYLPGMTIDSTSLDVWDRILSVDLTAAYIGTQICVPHLRRSTKSSIVNISSIAGIVGGNGAAYSASKAGLTLLSKDNAIELANDNIRVNSLQPGGVITPMTQFIDNVEGSEELIRNMCPMGRMAYPEEIAFGALFLASDEASYVTGAELVMDGGMTAR